MPKDDPKPKGKGAEDDDDPPSFDDSEFFKSEGIEDDEEKEAIRARARVHRYVNWRTAKEGEAADPKKKTKKPWYKGE